MDLFSSVDYAYTNLSTLNSLIWVLGGVWLFWLLSSYFWGVSRQKILNMLGVKWHMEKSASKMLWQVKGSYMVLFGSFVVILGCNIWGLMPYIFGITTQIAVTFTSALIMWLTMFLSTFFYSPTAFLAHLTPMGAPSVLIPPLNVIELVSQVIRPFTLALRLGINMTTGHMFIGLMGMSGVVLSFSSWSLLAFVFFLLWGYFLFEMGICVIQAFVFSLLSVQYLDEHT